MRPKHNAFHPANMTPQQRRDEVAAILARGVQRLRKRIEIARDDGQKKAPDSGRNPLEGRGVTRLSVPAG